MIAFQGEVGAYSHEAVLQTFGNDVCTLPCRTFLDVFMAVEDGQAELGMLPIENSTAGAINESYDLLLDYDLKITREVILPVRHALLAAPGRSMEEIRRVYSHPAALAQCEKFIARHGWTPVAAYDTAGAARQIASSGETDAAAIASETAGRLYGLETLACGIQDRADNYTRFFVIGRAESERSARAKTSVVLATRHTPGALYACLGEFATRGINLTKLESRPDRRRPWHYVFYLDFEGHWQDPACGQALVGLLTHSSFLKVLGSYPAAAPARPPQTIQTE